MERIRTGYKNCNLNHFIVSLFCGGFTLFILHFITSFFLWCRGIWLCNILNKEEMQDVLGK
jgi:hypothetical protein